MGDQLQIGVSVGPGVISVGEVLLEALPRRVRDAVVDMVPQSLDHQGRGGSQVELAILAHLFQQLDRLRGIEARKLSREPPKSGLVVVLSRQDPLVCRTEFLDRHRGREALGAIGEPLDPDVADARDAHDLRGARRRGGGFLWRRRRNRWSRRTAGRGPGGGELGRECGDRSYVLARGDEILRGRRRVCTVMPAEPIAAEAREPGDRENNEDDDRSGVHTSHLLSTLRVV